MQISDVYEEDPIVLDEDLLTLSVCLKRAKELDNTIWWRIQDPKLLKLVNQDDRLMADSIREYYKKKILIETLKTSHLSDFRKNLLSIINNTKNSYTPKEIGMFVSLSYFYEEDVLLDSFKENLDLNSVKRVTPNLLQHNFNLRLVGTTKRFINKKLQKRFWFANEENQPCLIMLENNNTLLNFFQSYITKVDHINLKANAMREFNPIPHIKLFNYTLSS